MLWGLEKRGERMWFCMYLFMNKGKNKMSNPVVVNLDESEYTIILNGETWVLNKETLARYISWVATKQ